MTQEKKAVFLLERTKDATSNIIGFYSSWKGSIEAVKRHVETTIDDEVARSREDSQDQRIGIYIQEGFLITRNEVEIEEDVAFDKIEDSEEFPTLAEELEEHHRAEDLGDVKDQHTEVEGHLFRDKN